MLEDFNIKDYVLGLLEESGKTEVRPKNMDTDDFLKYVLSSDAW